MIPTTEEITGNWISECTAPIHLDNLGCVIKFYFDTLPFDNHNVIRITSTSGKKETVLHRGVYSIEPSVNDEFFIVIDKATRIPARQYNETTFVSDLDTYGTMILLKR